MQTLSIFGGFMLLGIGFFIFGEACAKAQKGFAKNITDEIYTDASNVKLQKWIRGLEVTSAIFLGLAFIALIAGVTATSVRLIFF